jgi:hypothetical protein
MSKPESNSVQAPDLTEHVREIRTLARTTIDNIIEIGRRLTECKKLVAHGKWLPWLEHEFGWSESTALRFMRVYELGKSVTVTDLNLPVSTLYQLAAPSTPDAVKGEIVDRAEKGETITPATVKAEIAKRRPAKGPTKAQKAGALRAEKHYVAAVKAKAQPDVGEVAKLEAEVTELRCAKRLLEIQNLGLKSEVEERKAAACALTLQAAIERLIYEANHHLVRFINKLPEDVVYAAKDLDLVIDRLRTLNKDMAPRRKVAKQNRGKKDETPSTAPDDGLDIPEILRRVPAKTH